MGIMHMQTDVISLAIPLLFHTRTHTQHFAISKFSKYIFINMVPIINGFELFYMCVCVGMCIWRRHSDDFCMGYHHHTSLFIAENREIFETCITYGREWR